MFSLEQNGENLMISLEIDLERFGTHLKKVRKSNFLMISLDRNKIRWSPHILKNGASAFYWFTCFYYVLMISSLDHKKVFKCVPNCSKSTVISLDFCHFVLMKKMRFSYVLIISSECNKSRWSLQMINLCLSNFCWQTFTIFDRIGNSITMVCP